jgi:hypothetical protein
MKTSILLATTGRPEMAARAVKTAVKGAGDNTVQVVAAIDADPATFEALQDYALISYHDELRGCSRAWNDALRLATGDALVLAGDDLGVVAWECYGHGYNDREANARARAAGRYHWCEGAKVRHEHWTYGERVCDDTDTRNLARLAESEANFNRRAAEGFPDEVIA